MSVTRNRYLVRAYEDSGKSGEEKGGQVDAVIPRPAWADTRLFAGDGAWCSAARFAGLP